MREAEDDLETARKQLSEEHSQAPTKRAPSYSLLGRLTGLSRQRVAQLIERR